MPEDTRDLSPQVPVRRPRIVVRHVALIATACTLGGCASAPPEAFTDKLDPVTATTVTVLAQPVELVSTATHATSGDPFAYLAPFETDSMGDRSVYLWISVPQNGGALPAPKLFCDGKAVEMQPVEGDLTQFKLSRAPYALPAPWSGQWYFELPPRSLACLATATHIDVDSEPPAGPVEHFMATGKALHALSRFAHR